MAFSADRRIRSEPRTTEKPGFGRGARLPAGIRTQQGVEAPHLFARLRVIDEALGAHTDRGSRGTCANARPAARTVLAHVALDRLLWHVLRLGRPLHAR